MASRYYVAWWNVENLFDEENSPRRTEKVARALGNRSWAGRRSCATGRSPSWRR